MNKQRPTDDELQTIYEELTDEQKKRLWELDRLNGKRDFSMHAFVAGCVTVFIYYTYFLSKIGGMDHYWYGDDTGSELTILVLFGYIVSVVTMFIYEIWARNRVKGKIRSMGEVAGSVETEEYPTSLTNRQIGIILFASLWSQWPAIVADFAAEFFS